MITTEAELALTIEQLGRINRVISSLRETVLPKSPANYAVMVESYLETRGRMFDEIDAYLADQAPALRGDLIHALVQGHPQAAKQELARLAALLHAVQATRTPATKGDPGGFLMMLGDLLSQRQAPSAA